MVIPEAVDMHVSSITFEDVTCERNILTELQRGNKTADKFSGTAFSAPPAPITRANTP